MVSPGRISTFAFIATSGELSRRTTVGWSGSFLCAMVTALPAVGVMPPATEMKSSNACEPRSG